MADNPDCYFCKSKVKSFDEMECGELLKEGRHLFIDWWYWNGHKKNEPCPDICPKLKGGGRRIMTDILIRGMEMPKEHPLCIFICPDGRIVSEQHKPMSPVFDFCNATAVALPEHGDLIDRNELPIIGITDYKLESHTVVEFEDVQDAPVIVEANNE